MPGGGVADDILVEEWREAMVAHISQATPILISHLSGNKPTVGNFETVLSFQAVERHEGGRLGFWSPNCYHHVLSYILEDIYVSDMNNPDLALNGLQVN